MSCRCRPPHLICAECVKARAPKTDAERISALERKVEHLERRLAAQDDYDNERHSKRTTS